VKVSNDPQCDALSATRQALRWRRGRYR
jgi:hypothetical protein